ncbi:hypothetical protein [Borrelia turicatae]|uniref:hypothetical protein n=1 Tax=Borrelia turicatae TaxID=142 RepID=UPI001FF5502F|nr:hypothetical protein [Borrelia turicatae]UPA15841.1 hypothetical protein btBTE5EL_001534 [Borrelia turicatae]
MCDTVIFATENNINSFLYTYTFSKWDLSKKWIFPGAFVNTSRKFYLDKEYVIIIGCGGIGSFMTYSLATLELGSTKLLESILCNSKIKPSLIVLSADDDYCLPLVNKFCNCNKNL